MKTTSKQVMIGLSLLLIAVVAYFSIAITRTARRIPEAYAAWDTATLIIEFMDTHEGKWPSSWDDLFSAARALPHGGRALRGYSIDTLSTLPRIVRIDWNADPLTLMKATDGKETPPFRVVTRADGSDFPTVWSGAEPNAMILEYLQKTANKGVELMGDPLRGSPNAHS